MDICNLKYIWGSKVQFVQRITLLIILFVFNGFYSDRFNNNKCLKSFRLKVESEELFLIMEGISFHILGPINLIDCWHVVVLYLLDIIEVLLRVVIEVDLLEKNPLKAFGNAFL